MISSNVLTKIKDQALVAAAIVAFRESTLSSSVTRKDARLVLEGYNLTLQGVTTRDQGEYICEVSVPICGRTNEQVLDRRMFQEFTQTSLNFT